MEVNMKKLSFDENGLIPAIVQDVKTKAVLTLAYMNETSLKKTLETKETWFFSRKRKKLWNKGETSGNKQSVKHISFDCDEDALLIQVDPLGPACHKGKETCFHHVLLQDGEIEADVVNMLTNKIKERRSNPKDGTYTTYLFKEGIVKILKKVGEETREVIIGAKNNDKQELTWEIEE